MTISAAPSHPHLADDAARHRIRTDLERTYFVEAGAGSGKSTAMVGRVLSLIDAGHDITRIAAITFTEKAALELRVKIRSALDEAVRRAPADTPAERGLREHRRRQLEELDSAPIGTIHAFCANILRRLPLEAGVPPTLDVEDPSMQAVSFRSMWRQQRTRILAEYPDEAVALMDAGMRPGRLEEIARAFHQAWERAAAWLDAGGEIPSVGPGDLASTDHDCTVTWERAWHHVIQEFEDAAQRPLSGTSDAAQKTHERVLAYRELLRAAPGTDAISALPVLARIADLTSRGKVWGASMAESREQLSALNVAASHARTAGATILLSPLVREIAGAVVHEARERTRTGRLQFHDLLVLTKQLLVGEHRERAHAVLHEQYRWILVDEFQDTDPLQAEILFRLAARQPDADTPWHQVVLRPGQLFMVGDPKQSIYRFRGADISTYLAVQDALRRQPPLEDGTDSFAIESLVTNFRSDPDVLDWVNTAFGQLLPPPSPGSGAGVQASYEALDVRPEAPLPRAAPAVRTDLPRDHPGSLLPPLSAARLAALEQARTRSVPTVTGPAVLRCPMDEHEDLALLLKRLIGVDPAGNGLDGPAEVVTVQDRLGAPPRQIQPGDIAILLRSRTVLSDLEDALDAAGIEYRAEASNLIYATGEVRELRVILRAVANLADTGALALALRTSILGCGDDDLATWKAGGGAWNIHARVPAGLEDHPVARALEELQGLHRMARQDQPATLLDHLVESHLIHTVTQDSPRHRDVTRRLVYIIDQARAWWEQNHGSLRAYLDWVDLQDSDDGAGSEVVLDEQDSSAVRILTMHAAKGLEFPVVAVMSGKQSRSDHPALIWDPSGAPRISASSALRTPGYDDAQLAEKEALDAERMRLMYVACTRAQHLLIVPVHHGSPSPKHAVGQFLGLVLEGRAAAPTVPAELVEHYDARPADALTRRQAGEDAAPEPFAAERAPRSIHAPDEVPAWFDGWAELRERWVERSRRAATVAVSSLAHTPHSRGAATDEGGQPTAQGDPEAAPAPAPQDPGSAAAPAAQVPLGAAVETEEDDVAPVIGGAAFGTALHRVLELSRLDPAADLEAITDLVVRREQRTTGTTLDASRLLRMARFTLATTPLRDAAETGRFWFELDLVSALEGADPRADLLVGRADFVYFDGRRKLCVVDFKSDRAPSAALVDEYRQQVRTYLTHLSRISGAPAGDGYLIFAAPEFERVMPT